MGRLFVCDSAGWVTADIDTSGPILTAALDHEKADPVIRCAVLMALSALAKGDAWPTTALQVMSTFMASMKQDVRSEQLM